MNVVETHGLTKVYGDIHALDGVSLTVPEGSVFGFLGPNGAGKTTMLRILLGLARPNSGSATIFGHDTESERDAIHARVGYLPDVPGFYPWMTGAEFLRFAGSLFGIPEPALTERAEALLEMAGLAGNPNPVGGYSRGMKQRLGIAQALVNAPDLLVLDEPTSALDPLGRADVLMMIASLRGRATVLFSSHLLGDVERVCDQVAVLDRGRLVVQGSVADLRRSHGGSTAVRIAVTEGIAALVAAVESEPWCVRHTPVPGDGQATDVVVSDLAAARQAVPGIMAGLGLGLRRFDELEASLEEVFVGLVGVNR
ncbi:MAG: ATP-binding cassette domain-containing protein [Actinomycetota bacterium]